MLTIRSRDHREGLRVFVGRPQTPMDNNRAERFLRGPAIGRGLSFGSDSEKGAEFTAIMYSVLGTLSMNGIDIPRWLEAWLTACAENGRRPLDNLRQLTELLDDPARCVHICDREGDIWELFCLARELDTHFLIRRCSDRFAGDGSHTVASIMAEEKVRGVHSVAVRDDKGKLGSTQVELSYRRMTIRPPIAKQKRYPALMLTVLHAREPEEPVGRPRIDWKLITDLPVDGHDAAVEKLQWYAMRWKIEVFHKILKSGCRAEQARLRTAERLVRLLAVFCILSWRVFWLTMLNRAKPDLEPDLVLTVLETNILDRLIPDPTADPSPAKTLSLYLIKIARPGGYLARIKDPPPGNIVMWRGLSRSYDIALGATLQINDVGN